MQIQNRIVFSLAVAVAMTPLASAQRRTVPAMPGQVGVAITLQVAGQPYHFEGKAACQEAPLASIYNVAASMWSVQQREGQRSTTLTLWRPRNMSGDMFHLSVSTGAKSYLVNTVRGDGATAVQGSGKVTFTTSGGGGTFTIHATAANGATITGTIHCNAFAQAMAEGG
jgi:hypothetical protein